ncbi:MAG TPA: helix-turn-helix domain-containing protein [Streptosporangiaceae bacterium]|nr:helix-turn-helix domain-containing protein [Streptosporangiaceae bacterium]
MSRSTTGGSGAEVRLVTRVPRAGRRTDPRLVFPPELAEILRPELPSLTEDIVAEIRRTIPEYARPLHGPYGRVLQMAVGEALSTFVELITDPGASHEHRDQVCRKLGEYEAAEGRSLDSLQAAYRVGAHMAWRRAVEVGTRFNLSSKVMSQLADAAFSYIDELASLSTEGYLLAKATSPQSQEEWRQRLLRLILEQPAVPRRAIVELAELVGWPMPAQVTLVAIAAPVNAQISLPDDVLADFTATQPHLLLPAALDTGRRTMLESALAGRQAAVGVTVPLAEAADSIYWARQALALSRSGIIPPESLLVCDDHLLTLWLSEGRLLAQLARRQFAALAALPDRQQRRLTDTLAVWLETGGKAAEVAERLKIHPQTVRYRMRILERVLGEQLHDPDARFAMELVLRARRLNQPHRPEQIATAEASLSKSD